MKLVLSADWQWSYLLRLLSPKFSPGSASSVVHSEDTCICSGCSVPSLAQDQLLWFTVKIFAQTAQSQVWPRISFFCGSQWGYLRRLSSTSLAQDQLLLWLTIFSQAGQSQVWPRIRFIISVQIYSGSHRHYITPFPWMPNHSIPFVYIPFIPFHSSFQSTFHSHSSAHCPVSNISPADQLTSLQDFSPSPGPCRLDQPSTQPRTHTGRCQPEFYAPRQPALT